MNARLMRGPSRQEDEQIWKKLQLSLPNLRKIFNIVKFRRAYTTWENIISNNKRKICSLLLRKTVILTIIILMRRVLGERVYNFNINRDVLKIPEAILIVIFSLFLKDIFYWNGRNHRKPAIKLTVMLSNLLSSWNFLTERVQNLDCLFEVKQTTHSLDNYRTGLSVLHTVHVHFKEVKPVWTKMTR